MGLCLVKLDAPLDKPVRLGADFEKCTGPFYVVHCVNTSKKFLIDTGAAISLLPVRNVPIGVTVQHSDIVIEGISGETQRAVGKVNLKIQPQLSGKVYNVTFHIVPKAVFNLLGANFTDRYELANIIAFQARRLRAEETHVVARTTVVSDSTTDKLTLDEASLLAVHFDHGLPTFPEPRVTLNQARLDAIWRKLPHISDSESNFKQGLRMPFLQKLELKPDAKPRIAKVYPQSPEGLTAMKTEFNKFREYGFVIEGSSTWSAPSFAINKKDGGYRIVTNFSYLNSQLVPVMFPLPLISDLKMVVANKMIFSKFDVVKAFYSIGVREKDWQYPEFVQQYPEFVYIHIFMGICETINNNQEDIKLSVNCFGVCVSPVLPLCSKLCGHYVHNKHKKVRSAGKGLALLKAGHVLTPVV